MHPSWCGRAGRCCGSEPRSRQRSWARCTGMVFLLNVGRGGCPVAVPVLPPKSHPLGQSLNRRHIAARWLCTSERENCMVIAAYSRPVEGSRHIVRVRVLLLVRAYVRVRMCYVLYYTYSLTEFQNFICEHENARASRAGVPEVAGERACSPKNHEAPLIYLAGGQRSGRRSISLARQGTGGLARPNTSTLLRACTTRAER